MIAFAAIIVLAPDIYATTLKLGATTWPLPELTLLLALTAFLSLLSVGTLRRWRWLFWLILTAFPAGFWGGGVLLVQGVLAAPGPGRFGLLPGGGPGGAPDRLGKPARLPRRRRGGAWGRPDRAEGPRPRPPEGGVGPVPRPRGGAAPPGGPPGAPPSDRGPRPC